MKKLSWIILLFICHGSKAQRQSYSEQLAASAISRWSDPRSVPFSSMPLLLRGMELVWSNTGNGQYYQFISSWVDNVTSAEGKLTEAPAPSLIPALQLAWQVTKKERYRKALAYMDSVNGKTALHNTTVIDEKQSRLQIPQIALSGNQLEAKSLAETKALMAGYIKFADSVRIMQDKTTSLWHPEGQAENAGDIAASALVVYTLASGLRLGYLDQSYLNLASSAYQSILARLRSGSIPGADGASATGNLKEQLLSDPAYTGALILASAGMERMASAAQHRGKKVLLDYYYNNERQKDDKGNEVRFHYTWEDRSNSGYSMLGHIFESHGATLARLETSAADLRQQQAGLYIIVDPDTEKESAGPHFIEAADIAFIKSWVKDGGVLLLLGNDKGNAEFSHLNALSGEFGIHFNEDRQNTVVNDTFAQGVVMTPSESEVFGRQKKLFIKEYSSLNLTAPARSLLRNGNVNVMAVSPYGKGYVVALGDPWIYNEYLDGRKLPRDFNNYEATVEWVNWLLGKTKQTSPDIIPGTMQ